MTAHSGFIQGLLQLTFPGLLIEEALPAKGVFSSWEMRGRVMQSSNVIMKRGQKRRAFPDTTIQALALP